MNTANANVEGCPDRPLKGDIVCYTMCGEGYIYCSSVCGTTSDGCSACWFCNSM